MENLKFEYKIFLLMIISMFLITGCSQKQGVNSNVNAMTVKEEQTDVMGEIRGRETVQIQSIVGNELIVEILKEKEGAKNPPLNGENGGEGQIKNKESQNTQRAIGVMTGPGGFGGMGPGGGRENQNSSSDAMKERMEQRFEHTEETKTITIPVGAPIHSMGMGDGTSELDASDLSKDSYITILYGDENKEKIVGVQVLS